MKPINYLIEEPEQFLIKLNGQQARELNFLRADLDRTRSSLVREALVDLSKKYQDRFNQGKRQTCNI